jgi:hypothetical protein
MNEQLQQGQFDVLISKLCNARAISHERIPKIDVDTITEAIGVLSTLNKTTPPAQPTGDNLTPLEAQPADLNLNCKSVQARLAAQWGYVKREWVGLTETQKVDLAGNWFAEDWAITKGVGMLHDYDAKLREKNGGAA